jgi:pilus assembly protein CpaD
MRSPLASRAASGFRPAALGILILPLLAGGLAGCKTIDEPGAHVAGWTLIDPSQRHPIMVSQKPANLTIRVARGSHGLSPAQRAQVTGFLQHYRGTAMGNSRLVIAVPGGSANETATVRAVSEMRHLIADMGFSDTTVAIEPYTAPRNADGPIRLSYLQYVAEGPECGRWTENLAYDPRNLPHANFGCAQQRNLAAQIANPADLLGPRSMTPADAERRTVVFDKYHKGQPTAAEKTAEERVQVKGAN